MMRATVRSCSAPSRLRRLCSPSRTLMKLCGRVVTRKWGEQQTENSKNQQPGVPPALWESGEPLPSTQGPKRVVPVPTPQRPRHPHGTKPPGVRTFFLRIQDSQIPDPARRALQDLSPAFIPGLAVGCRQHPLGGDEGSTAVKASALEEGHLPRLGVGRALLTFQHLAVVLGGWESR